uniref:Uncharacterized protein n=1 Tax=Cacopsylla melanoneura TaxID=428564 RepID=A0A8D8M6I2_9HEMI
MLSSIVLLIVLTVPIALFSFSALGRAQSPTNGGIPVQQVSTGETMLPNNHSQHQIDRAVAMVKTEIEKTFLPLIPLLVTSLFENNSSDVADIKTQQQIEKFENGFATAFGLNNTVNSTIQTSRLGFDWKWIAKKIAELIIPIILDEVKKHWIPKPKN